MITFITNDDRKRGAVTHNTAVMEGNHPEREVLGLAVVFFCWFSSFSCTFLVFSGGVSPRLVHFTRDQAIFTVYNSTKNEGISVWSIGFYMN